MAIVNSALAVFQAAFPLVGCDVPSSIDDDTPEAKAAKASYDIFVKEALERHAFSWATKREALVYQEDTGGNPRFAYQLPSDLVTLYKCKHADFDFRDFILEEGRLLCDLNNVTDLIAVFGFRATENLWPADFTEAMIDRLASRLATGLLDRPQQGDALEKRAEYKLRRAIRRDRRQFPGTKAFNHTNLQRKWQGSSTLGRAKYYGSST